MADAKNPFMGINPHLNSLLQTPGTNDQPSMWSAFHSAHLVNIAEFLNAILPGNYIALSEHSLQVFGDDCGARSGGKASQNACDRFSTEQNAHNGYGENG